MPEPTTQPESSYELSNAPHTWAMWASETQAPIVFSGYQRNLSFADLGDLPAGERVFYARPFFGSESGDPTAGGVQTDRPFWHYRNMQPALKGFGGPFPQIDFELPDRRAFDQDFDKIKETISKDKTLAKAVLVVRSKGPKLSEREVFALALRLVQEKTSRRLPARAAYGFSMNGRGILGASPELFLRVDFRTGRLETVALAGTRRAIGVGAQDEAQYQADLSDFLTDPKERTEHALVVEDMVGRLSRFGTVNVGPMGWAQFGELTHLQTPISCDLNATSPEALETLIDSLHPTPALGVKSVSQLDYHWLSRLSVGRERNFFGAPIGVWTAGESFELYVAIRGLQWTPEGSEILSGCGIVAESVADHEWQELLAKRDFVRKVLAANVASGNLSRARALVDELLSLGVTQFVLCPGGRNAPLVKVLHEVKALPDGIGPTIHTFYEERSAAFFALGLSKKLSAPVAVVTTSGTAAAELLPAMVEATYSSVPLMAVTADRPGLYRGTGAPQTMNQLRLFGEHAAIFVNCPVGATVTHSGALSALTPTLKSWDQKAPLHVNIEFSEPLLTDAVTTAEFSAKNSAEKPPDKPAQQPEAKAGDLKAPLVLLGPMSAAETEFVTATLGSTPVYAEGASGMGHSPSAFRNLPEDDLLTYFDGVIRVGGVPTCRLWRDLEDQYQALPVFSFSSQPYSGLARPSRLGTLQEVAQLPWTVWKNAAQLFEWHQRSRVIEHQALDRLALKPLSEEAWVLRISDLIPAHANVFLGNSLPIRTWDMVAVRKPFRVQVNRGMNGIDGLISTFAGTLKAHRENWLLLGDLSALYDMAGFDLLARLKTSDIVRIVVLNNGGGKIFAPMFNDQNFLNEHQLRFDRLAAMFGFSYSCWHAESDVLDSPVSSDLHLIEVVPEPC
jgi:2-succinyl-5-enolpyruvyl-6-hydroxy-3-cyclohexene-1-carboxylate synthase